MADTPRSLSARSYCAMVAVAAAGAAALAATTGPAPLRFKASDHPAAALAWAQTRCAGAQDLRLTAGRAQAEDLRAVAAAFDAELLQRPLADVCTQALRIGAVVATRANGSESSGQAAHASQPDAEREPRIATR